MTAIFVPSAHARACVAVIRSLGRAGYEVHAASHLHSAIGLRSRYAQYSAIYPPADDPQFINWMRDYVERHDIRMIVPVGILDGLRPRFDEFKSLLPVTHDEEVLYGCSSKTEVVKRFKAADPALGLMKHHPASSVIDLESEVNADRLPASETGYFIKAEGSGRQCGDNSISDFAFVENAEKVADVLAAMSAAWDVALVQEACSGVQIGVSVLMDEGDALAVSCVRDCHIHPHSKGTMSLRESCWFQEIIEDAIRRLSYLRWQGCAMCEYRYDESSGEFNLIEINFRYWQYLHLDLWAGMDFPRMQAEWFLEGTKAFDCQYRLGVVCRDTWPGEVAQLVNEIRRPESGVVDKVTAVTLFLARFFDPRIHQDFFFPGDRYLYFLNMKSFFVEELKRLSKRGLLRSR